MRRPLLSLALCFLAVHAFADEPKYFPLRSYADPMPKQLGPDRFRQGAAAFRLAYSSDGKLLASSDQSFVRLWEVATGKERFQLYVGNSALPVGSPTTTSTIEMLFSGDGKWLAVADNSTAIRLFDTDTGQAKELLNHREMTALTLGHDGKSFWSAGGDGTLRLYLFRTGQELRRFAIGQQNCPVLIRHQDPERMLIVNYDNVCREWDLKGNKEVRAFTADRAAAPNVNVGMNANPADRFSQVRYQLASQPHQFRLSRDGKYLFQTRSRTLWNFAEGKQVLSLTGVGVSTPAGCDFHPDGHSLLVASSSFTVINGVAQPGQVQVVDLPAGQERRTLPVLNLSAAAFSPDGQIAALAGRDGVIRFWKVGSKEIEPLDGHAGPISDLAVSGDGNTLASLGTDRKITFWNLPSSKRLGEWNLETSTPVLGLAFHPNHRTLVTFAHDTGITHWEWDKGPPKKLERFGPEPAKTAIPIAVPNFSNYGFLPPAQVQVHGKLAATVRGNEYFVHDIENGKLVGQIQKTDAYSGAAFALSPRGPALLVPGNKPPANPGGGPVQPPGAFGSSRSWNLISIATKKPMRSFASGHVTLVAVSPDGRLAFARANQHAIYELSSGLVRREIHFPHLGVFQEATTAQFSPDSRYLAVGGYSQAAIFDAYTGQLLKKLEGHRGYIRRMRFTPSGDLVTAGVDSVMLVWPSSLWREARPQLDPETLVQHIPAFYSDLARPEADVAGTAISMLIAVGDPTVKFFEEKLEGPQDDVRPNLEKWIKDLDSDRFDLRQRAQLALEKSGDVAHELLMKAREGTKSLEMRQRIDQILQKSKGPAGELLRQGRALEVLERIATPAARALLKKLAEDGEGSATAEEAQGAPPSFRPAGFAARAGVAPAIRARAPLPRRG